MLIAPPHSTVIFLYGTDMDKDLYWYIFNAAFMFRISVPMYGLYTPPK